ncbi:MAG: hypothetical protein Q4D62_08960 [Planctomycetia bacterium]|nr:hypothetical protein [Planctomycetia bacterium]
MSFSLFHIPCPTCEARLRISSEKLLGQIVPCPKCGSMVLVPLSVEQEENESLPEEKESPPPPPLPETDGETFLSEKAPPAISPPPVARQEIQPPVPPPVQPSFQEEEDFPVASSDFSLDQPLSTSALVGRILLLGGVVFVVLTGILLIFRGCSPTPSSPSSDAWQISEKIYPSSGEESAEDADSEIPEEPRVEENAETDIVEEEELASTEEPSLEEEENLLSEELMQSELGRQLLSEQKIPSQENQPLENGKTSQENISATSEKKRITIDSSDVEEELDILESEKEEPPQGDRLEFQRKSRPSLFVEEREAERAEPAESLRESLENFPDLAEQEDVFAEEETSQTTVPSSRPAEKRSSLTTVSETATGEYLPESIVEKLDIPLKTFQMEEKPITGVLKMVTQISGISLYADWKRLKKLGVEPDRTLSLRLQDTTVREVLERVLEECSLGCMPARQTLRVVGLEVTEMLREAAHNGEKLERTTLNLEDLATTNTLQSHNAQSGLQEILRLIRTFVHPATWDEYGGPGKITSSRSAAKVNLSHYPSMIEEVQRFCNQLRFARKMPLQEPSETAVLRGRQDGTQMGEADTTPRWIQSEKARKRLISCDFSDGMPLREVLAEIARTAKIQLILEEEAIARISVKDLVMDAEIPGYDGKKPDLPTNMLGLKVAKSFENLTLEEVLTDVIRPFPLFCYPVSADVFFLTTPQSAARKTMVEFYPVGDILSQKEASGIFLDGIRQKIAPQTWKNAGGIGEIVYDAPSRSLIVLQSPLVLRQVEHFLEQYRQRSRTARGAE